MSSLRVINVSPEENHQLSEDILQERDELLDSPVSTPNLNDTRSDWSGGLFGPMSAFASPAPASVFEVAEETYDEHYTEPTTVPSSGQDITEEDDSYSLKPPPPALAAQTGLESLATRFFSIDHLDEILRDYGLAFQFTNFLAHYRPAHSETLKQYAEARKAMAAVHYANATAAQIEPSRGHPPLIAAAFDAQFEERTRRIVEDLVEEALPAYLTHRLVALVTDTLVKDITGNIPPVMRDLVPTLAEVYCITDPSMQGNPIVYASEAFYSSSQYAKEHVIGRSCRFLQGPKTSPSSMRRLTEALARGEEACETLLNYRRDGSPFMNLLMVAPLYDNKGAVRYFLGCQIDVTCLIENGRGLESFAQLLSKNRLNDGYGRAGQDPKEALEDFGRLLTKDEVDTVKDRTRQPTAAYHALSSLRSSSAHRPNANRDQSIRSRRVVLGMNDAMQEPDPWPGACLNSSGRVPGVYRNYMLVRPYPSLRITFTSPALRIPGLLQTKFLDRIDGPLSVREGLVDALSCGTGVTAKVTWLTCADEAGSGKPRWIHCTPLFGSDDQVGVWMVVMVENEQVTGSLNAHGNVSRTSSLGLARRPDADGCSINNLYADYLRREARPLTSDTQQTSTSTMERREADEHFRDF